MVANIKVIALVLTIVMGSIYSFVTQSTDADSVAVYNTDMIFGYDVTGIIFDLDDASPTSVDAITFHIAPSHGSTPANHVKVQTEAEGAWTECSLVDDVLPARAVTCTFESLTVENVTELKIVAR